MAVYMYMSIHLFFCLIVFHINICGVISGFNKVEAVSAFKGSTIQLECPYSVSPQNSVKWFKKVNGTLQTFSKATEIHPQLELELKSRLKVTGDHRRGQYHLSIYDVRKSDEGTYQCSPSGTVKALYLLQLTVITNIPTSVSIENVGLEKKLNGIEGRNLIIRCSAAGGDPAPDVKLLISESVVTVGKQSVQYTLSSVNRSYDGQNVECLAGYEEIAYYSLNDSARIYLKLKPNPPIFSSASVITEETKPLVISCKSNGSRPMASIYWLLGNGRANVTTYATQLPHSHDPTTDTYTVTSTLTYSVNRSYNGQNLICVASNEATSEPGGSAETSETLNVKYAPDITVNSPPYTQNDAIRTITCHPSGNPDSYTYHKWQHKSRYGDLIREFAGNKTLKIPNVPVLLRYQDSGEYVCTASNGIRDNDNMFEQIGSGYVIVNAQPVFTSDTIDKAKQFGEISKAVDIYVNVYSVPKFAIYIWTRDGKPITNQNSAKYASSSSPTIVNDKIHGKEVHLDGYNVTLTIRDLTAHDFNNYSLTLKSGFADVTHTIVLESTKTSTTRSAVIGGVVGAVVTLGIVCASVMVIVLLKRRKGQNKTEKNDKSYENTGFQERKKDDEYEEVRNKCDVQQKQSSKTYETLGTKDTLNIYDGLDTSKARLGHYEALGVHDKPNIYSELENQKEQTQLRQQPTEKNPLKASNNPNEYLDLKTTHGPIENVYANERF